MVRRPRFGDGTFDWKGIALAAIIVASIMVRHQHGSSSFRPMLVKREHTQAQLKRIRTFPHSIQENSLNSLFMNSSPWYFHLSSGRVRYRSKWPTSSHTNHVACSFLTKVIIFVCNRDAIRHVCGACDVIMRWFFRGAVLWHTCYQFVRPWVNNSCEHVIVLYLVQPCKKNLHVKVTQKHIP